MSELQKHLNINLFAHIEECSVELNTPELLKELGFGEDEKLDDLELAKLSDEISYLTTKYVSENLLNYVENTLLWEQMNLNEYIQRTRGQEVNNYDEEMNYDYIIENGSREWERK